MKNIEKYIIGILVFIAVGAIGAAVYFGISTDKDNSKKEENKQEDVLENDRDESFVDDNIEEDNKQEEADKIYAKINSSKVFLFPDLCHDEYSYGEDFANKFFGKGISLNEFTKEDLITSAFYEIENIPVCSDEKVQIDIDTINLALEKKFKAPNLKINLNDLKKYDGETLNFEFDGEKIYVFSNNCDGCGIGPMPFYKKTIEKYEVLNNSLYVYYRVAYFNEGYMNGDNSISYDVFKPTDLKNRVEQYNEKNGVIKWEKYPLYKAIYELIDGELYFRTNEIIEK